MVPAMPWPGFGRRSASGFRFLAAGEPALRRADAQPQVSRNCEMAVRKSSARAMRASNPFFVCQGRRAPARSRQAATAAAMMTQRFHQSKALGGAAEVGMILMAACNAWYGLVKTPKIAAPLRRWAWAYNVRSQQLIPVRIADAPVQLVQGGTVTPAGCGRGCSVGWLRGPW